MTTTQYVPLSQLVEDPDNPRGGEVGDVSALATSIKNMGVLQSLRVRELDDGKLAVIAGSRRHAAMRAAKLPADFQVPVLITTENGAHSSLVGLVENAQREDLNVYQQADTFARLISEFGLKQKQIAEMTGFDASLVSRRVAVSKLSQAARDAIDRVHEHIGREAYVGEDLVKLAKNYASVPDEVWSVINTSRELHDMQKAQDLHNVKARLTKAGTIAGDELVVVDHEDLVAPEAHTAKLHQDRSANNPDDVTLEPGDAGVVLRYSSWIPVSFEPVDVEAEQAEKAQAKDERAKQRADKARAKTALALWNEQWWAALSKYPAAKAKAFIIEDTFRLAKKAYGQNPCCDAHTVKAIGEVVGLEQTEHGSYLPAFNAAMDDPKRRLQLYMLASVIGGTHTAYLTGDPADGKALFAAREDLEQLRKELKIRVPKVAE